MSAKNTPKRVRFSNENEEGFSDDHLAIICDNRFLERQLRLSQEECKRLEKKLRHTVKSLTLLGLQAFEQEEYEVVVIFDNNRKGDVEERAILVEKVLRRCKRLSQLENHLKDRIEETSLLEKENIRLRFLKGNLTSDWKMTIL